MKIKSSGSKGKLERSGKVLITSLVLKTKSRSQKYKKAMYPINNVSKKDLSKNIREFEKFEKILYNKKRPKHEPTDCYFYLARQIAKFMMRSNTLNWHDYGGYTEMTALSSKVYSTDEDESKHIIVHKGLSQYCSTNEGKSKRSIVNENLSRCCVIRTMANQNRALATKLYCRVVLRTGTNQNAVSSMKLYRRNVLQTRTNEVIRRNTKHNAPLRNKKIHRMRFHTM